MATLFLTFAAISAAPAILARDPAWSVGLGANALVWAGLAVVAS